MMRVVVPLVAVLVTGCTAVAWTAYKSATEERTLAEQVSDTMTGVTIRERLHEADANSILFLDVFCHLGQVVIVGAVAPESPLRLRAATIARNVEGVQRVETYYVPSQLPETGGLAIGVKLMDLAIGAQFMARLVGDTDLMAAQVDFAVLGGHVVLAGVVDRQAKIDRIVAHARAVEGVMAVRSFMQIKPPQN